MSVSVSVLFVCVSHCPVSLVSMSVTGLCQSLMCVCRSVSCVSVSVSVLCVCVSQCPVCLCQSLSCVLSVNVSHWSVSVTHVRLSVSVLCVCVSQCPVCLSISVLCVCVSQCRLCRSASCVSVSVSVLCVCQSVSCVSVFVSISVMCVCVSQCHVCLCQSVSCVSVSVSVVCVGQHPVCLCQSVSCVSVSQSVCQSVSLQVSCLCPQSCQWCSNCLHGKCISVADKCDVVNQCQRQQRVIKELGSCVERLCQASDCDKCKVQKQKNPCIWTRQFKRSSKSSIDTSRTLCQCRDCLSLYRPNVWNITLKTSFI